MKILKRALAMVLACALLCTSTMIAGAADKFTATVGSGTLEKGSTVAIPVDVSNNTGFAGVNVQFVYDTDSLELKQITNSYKDIDATSTAVGTTSGGFLMPNVAQNRVSWMGMANVTADGTIFWLVFSAKDDVINDDYSVSINYAPGSDCMFNDALAATIDVATVAGTITVTGGIDPATLSPTVTAQPADKSYTYGDTAEALTITATVPEGCTEPTYQWYSNTADSNENGTAIEGETGTAYTPALNEYGTAYYYCVATTTFKGREFSTASDAAAITYEKAALADEMVTLDKTELQYTGAAQGPAVTVGVDASEYTVTGNSETAVGDYTVTVAANADGNYTGTVTKEWKITPADLTVTGTKVLDVYNNGQTIDIPETVIKAETVDGTAVNAAYVLKTGETLFAIDEAGKVTSKMAGEGEGSIEVTYTADNHNSVTETITVKVQNKKSVSDKVTGLELKADAPTVYAPEWNYTLADFVTALDASAVTADGTATITYTINGEAAELTTAIPGAGEYVVEAVYEDVTQKGTKAVTIKVEKLTIDVSAWTWNLPADNTYTGEAMTVTVNADDKVDVTYPETNNVKTDAGEYTAKATLAIKADYAANYELSAAELTQAWSIVPKTIDVSGAKAVETAFGYDGTEKTVALETALEHVVVTTEGDAVTQTKAGSYTTTFKFAAENGNYAISGSDLVVNWTIAKAEVTIPAANTGLVYTGQEQQGVPAAAEGAAYILSDVLGTDAGEYTSTATLVDEANYKWAGLTGEGESAPQSIKWTIAKAAAITGLAKEVTLLYSNTAAQTILAADLHATAGDIEITKVVTVNTDGALAADAEKNAEGTTVTYKLAEGLTAADANKTATITVTFNSKNYETSDYVYTVKVIDKTDVSDKITFANGEATYNGKAQTIAAATITGEGLNGTFKYEYKDAAGAVVTEAKDAGTYTVTATYEDDKNIGTKEATFTIAPAALTVADGTVTAKTYDGKTTAEVTAVTFNGLMEGETLAAADYTVTGEFADANVGEGKTVNLTVALAETVKNYTLTAAAGTAKGTITALAVEVTLGDIAAETFTGKALTPAVTVTAKGTVDAYALVEGTDYTVAYDNNTNAGEAAVKVTAKAGSNYTFTEAAKNFTINKAAAPALVGATASYKFSLTGDKTAKITGVPANAGTTTYAVGTVVDAAGILAGTPTVDAGVVKYTLKGLAAYVDGATATIPVTVTMANYADATANVVISITDKDAPVLAVEDVTVTYTGTALTAEAIKGTATFGGNAVAGTWSWITDPATMVNANEYTAEVKFVPTDAVNYSEGTAKLKVVVNKADSTGEPTYTAIKSSGKTLADAALAIGTIVPAEGTLAWDLEDTTVVESGKAYAWTFTPANPNYNVLKGEITLYRRSSGGAAVVAPSNKVEAPVVVGGGTVTVNTTAAAKGDKVTITVTPDEGNVLGTVQIKDANGVEIPVIDNGDGTYTFEMPETAVSVSVDFTAKFVFVDVPADCWYEDAVYDVVGKGLFTGTSATTFAPNMDMSRAMMVTVLARMDGVDTTGSTPWYKAGMDWAVANGISDGTNPEGMITREQLATMLYRYAQYKQMDVSVGEDTNILSYADAFSVSEWAMSAMQWACGSGLIKGTNANELLPGDSASRAEVAMILSRFVEEIAK